MAIGIGLTDDERDQLRNLDRKEARAERQELLDLLEDMYICAQGGLIRDAAEKFDRVEEILNL